MRAVNQSEAPAAVPAPFRARLAPRCGGAGEIGRLGWATPESVQALVDDTRLVGRGGRLEIRFLSGELPQARAWLDELARAMRRRGVTLRVIQQESNAAASAARQRRAA